MISERHDDVTYRVIGAAMRVHNALGPGLKESAYQKALGIEFENERLAFQAEHPVDIVLDGVSIGLLYLDHLVEEKIVVEEKAVSHPLTNDGGAGNHLPLRNRQLRGTPAQLWTSAAGIQAHLPTAENRHLAYPDTPLRLESRRIHIR